MSSNNRTQNSQKHPGSLGDRNRSGRSGLDPLDTNREQGRMEGIFFRNLFTFNLRTRNGFYLLLMFLLGVVPFGFLIVAVFTTLLHSVEPANIVRLICPFFLMLVTGLITVNFILSILQIAKVIPPSKR